MGSSVCSIVILGAFLAFLFFVYKIFQLIFTKEVLYTLFQGVVILITVAEIILTFGPDPTDIVSGLIGLIVVLWAEGKKHPQIQRREVKEINDED